MLILQGFHRALRICELGSAAQKITFYSFQLGLQISNLACRQILGRSQIGRYIAQLGLQIGTIYQNFLQVDFDFL